MSEGTFVDSSVVVKLFDNSVPAKQMAAKARLAAERLTGGPTISPIVLGEVFHALTKPRRTNGVLLPPIADRRGAAHAIGLLNGLNVVSISPEIWAASLDYLTQFNRLGSWDALHLATAVAMRCETLLTWDTDFPNETIISGVRVEHLPY